MEIVKEVLQADDLFKEFDEEAINDILEDLENYIMRKIYRRVIPDNELPQDRAFYEQCERLAWIQPAHLEINQKFVNERLWSIGILSLQKMDYEKSPKDKLNCVQNTYKILNNCIIFCSGKTEGAGVDDIIPILIYIIIKSKPKKIFTNLQYCKSLIPQNKLLTSYGFLITQIDAATEFIMRISKDVLKITEEEFNK